MSLDNDLRIARPSSVLSNQPISLDHPNPQPSRRLFPFERFPRSFSSTSDLRRAEIRLTFHSMMPPYLLLSVAVGIART